MLKSPKYLVAFYCGGPLELCIILEQVLRVHDLTTVGHALYMHKHNFQHTTVTPAASSAEGQHAAQLSLVN